MAKVGKITLDSQPDEYILRPHRLNYIVMEDGEVHSIWDTQEQADNTILELIHNEGQCKCVIKESNRIPLNPYDIRHRSSSSEDCRGSISASSSNSSSSSSSSASASSASSQSFSEVEERPIELMTEEEILTELNSVSKSSWPPRAILFEKSAHCPKWMILSMIRTFIGSRDVHV